MNLLLTLTPIAISILAAYYAYKANAINREGFKESFRNNLINKLKEAKYMILKLEIKTYEHREKMLLIESINDHLLYQQNSKEKKKYMSEHEMNKLSLLQEEVEDYIGVILIGQDIAENKDLAINVIKNYLKDF